MFGVGKEIAGFASARSRRGILPTFLFPRLGVRLMNADLVAVLEFWEREKGIKRDVLIGAVQEALLSAAKKAVGPAREMRCVIDPKNGDIKAFAKLVVSEKVTSKHDQISLPEAKRIKPDAVLGDELE